MIEKKKQLENDDLEIIGDKTRNKHTKEYFTPTLIFPGSWSEKHSLFYILKVKILYLF